MPYPSPITYPPALLSPGLGAAGGQGRSPVALGSSVVLNTVDEAGTVWALDEFTGWSGSPAGTLELSQRSRGHGATRSESFLKHKVMTLSGRIKTQDAEAMSAALDSLNAAVSLDPFPLSVSESGRIRSMTVQRQDDVIAGTVKRSATLAAFSVQVSATDPLKYGELISASTLLPSSSGGLVYPATYPVTYTGVSNNGVARLHNAGNTQAPIWLRVDGPVPAGGWTITHVRKNQSLAFATSLALEAGEFVTVDMERREVLAQGQSARAGYVTSRGWFSLDPGDNDIAFSAQNYSSTAQLTVTTKPAWI